MRCASCSEENPDGVKFCGACGTSLEGGTPCPDCGSSNPPGANYCHECARSIREPSTPTPAPAPDLPSSVAEGRYEVQRFLGEGGTKRVYLARDTRLDRSVAVALIKTEGLDETGLARVRREAEALGKLGDHPHIVIAYDVGEDEDQPYIVSQYLAGGDLEGLLREAENHTLPIADALEIGHQVCQALEHAHGSGIIHRDLKPSNVWFTEDRMAKLGDFGLAVATDRVRLTQAGTIVGTAAYMPPELAVGGGRTADVRSDLYSFGAMLYEMVTGRPPFQGDTIVSIISQHINTAPVAPTWHNPAVPRALETLIIHLLAKAPDERPRNAAAVVEALRAISSAKADDSQQVVPEEANPLDRLAGGIFVGREPELGELRAGLADALSGKGRLVMLVGEAGIGKTRTVEEFATYAQLRDAQVLWGRCYEGDGAPAYWPWVQLIRSYVRERDPKTLFSEMGPGAADIAQVVSAVRETLPGLPEPAALEAEQARFRLFDSITTFLKNASISQPLVLVLDDLHWADKSSLMLLAFLARELEGARLLVVGTYRDIELDRKHPLAETLAELAREQATDRVTLSGLGQEDVARFIEMTAGRPPPEALVTTVYRETEGNPFFVSEIVRLLVTSGRLEHLEDGTSWSVMIPQGVREVIGSRLEHLSDDCRRVLTIASVVGRDFGQDVLERLADDSGDRLLDLLEEALAARIVEERPGVAGQYTFSHALIRDTLSEELSQARRARLHQRIGEVLEGLFATSRELHLAEVAHHFVEGAKGGGDVEKAVDYSKRAGDRAIGLHAYAEAVKHYERGLEVLELKHLNNEAEECELFVALGGARWRVGDIASAKEAFQRAADGARKIASSELLAQAALGFAGPPETGGADDEVLVALLEEALASLDDGDGELRCKVLARLAVPTFLLGHRERGGSLSNDAVEMARRIDAPILLAYTLRARRWALMSPESLDDRLAQATEIIRLAEQAGDKEMAMFGYGSRLHDLLELGDIVAVDQVYEAGTPIVEELRHPMYVSFQERIRAEFHLLEGRFEEAEQAAQQALALGQRAQVQDTALIFAAQIALLRWEQGRFQELEPLMRSLIEQQPDTPLWHCALAVLYSELDQRAEAQAEFDRLAASDFVDLWQDGRFLIGFILLSEVCHFLGDTQRAARLYEHLLPFASRCIVIPIAVACCGSGARYLGILAATMSRWDEAAQHFEAALEMNARIRAWPYVAHTQHEYADMLLSRAKRGDQERALELSNEALRTAQELGMKGLVEKALSLKLKIQGVEYGDTQSSISSVAITVQSEQPDLRPHAAPDGTVTLLFTDIVGSTALNERLGDQRWLELLLQHNNLVREQIQPHDGFEVKTIGDAFMVAFGSARDAVQCAIAIQRAFAQHNKTTEEPFGVRVGLHTGEAIKEADDFYGTHVTLASRIADEAKGGEILVSALLRELTESGGDINFSEGRDVEFKGFSEGQQVFAVNW